MKLALILTVLISVGQTLKAFSPIPNRVSLLVCLDLSKGEFVWTRPVGFSYAANVEIVGDFVQITNAHRVTDGSFNVQWFQTGSGEPVDEVSRDGLTPGGTPFPQTSPNEGWPIQGYFNSSVSFGNQVLVSSRSEARNSGSLYLFTRGEPEPRWVFDVRKHRLPKSRLYRFVGGAFGDKYVYVYSGGYLWALDKSSGKIIKGVDTTKNWSYLSSASDPAYLIPYKDSIVVVNGSVLFAMDAELNRVLWMKLMHRGQWGYPYSVLHEDRLYFLKGFSRGVQSMDEDWWLRITR